MWLPHDYTNFVEEYLLLLDRRVFHRIDRQLNDFADALNDFLYWLADHPTPQWRDQLRVFFKEEAAYGRLATEDSRRRLEEYLELWAKVNGVDRPQGEAPPPPDPALYHDIPPFTVDIPQPSLEVPRMEMGSDKPRVIDVQIIKGFWDDYDEKVASGEYDPILLLRAAANVLRTISPSSEPTIRKVYEDGTEYYELGGGPTSGELGLQAVSILVPYKATVPIKSVKIKLRAFATAAARETAEDLVTALAEEATGLPVPISVPKLKRPRLRKKSREIIVSRAPKTAEGRFIDPNTGEPIEGIHHFGHVYGHEHRRLVREAEERGMTQPEFNEWVNQHPEWFQIEEPKSNMSHRFEKPGNSDESFQ